MPMAIPPLRAQGNPRSGVIYGARAAASSSAQSANVLTLWPVFIERPVPIDRLVFWTNTAVVGLAKMAWFDDTGAGAAGALRAEGSTDVSTNNAVAVNLCPLAANFTPLPGLSWIGICLNAAANLYSATGTGNAANDWLKQFGEANNYPTGGNPRVYRTAALTYVSGPTPFMPATCGAMTFTDAVGATPILGWRAA